MDIPKLKLPSFSVSLTRLPRLAAIVISSFSILLLGALAWFYWNNIIIPYQQTTVSQEKITKKLETLNVKDFETVQSKATAKTAPVDNLSGINPFGPKSGEDEIHR